MDLSKIPNRLRGKPYFCLMKLEQKPGKDKKDKVPYRTNGARADPTMLLQKRKSVCAIPSKMICHRGMLQKNSVSPVGPTGIIRMWY